MTPTTSTARREQRAQQKQQAQQKRQVAHDHEPQQNKGER